jgi:hypothetical protein
MKAVVLKIAIRIRRKGNVFEMNAVLMRISMGIHMQASPQQAREGHALKLMQF